MYTLNAGGSPEHRRTFSLEQIYRGLQYIFRLAYIRGGGGVGGLLTSCEVRYRKDVVALMMLLCRRCACLEDVVMLAMLLGRR